MTTDSQGFSGEVSNIPVTHKEFEAWLGQHKAEWPAELQTLGERAKLTLWQLDNNPPSTINAMQEFAPNAWRAMTKTMVDFAQAYGVWRGKER